MSKFLSKQNQFSFGCLNIRGVLNKHEQVTALLSDCNFDILGLCETFLDDNVADYVYKIDGFNVVCKNRNRHGGGVLFYVKEGVKFEVIDMNVSKHIESLWIKVKLSSDYIVVGIMYRPPSANVCYYNAILDQLDYVHAQFDKVILMGDLNYNYDFNVSLSSNPLHNIETMYDMKQLVTKPTRVTLTTSTLLDIILSNVPQLHIKTDVYETSMSDHYLVYSLLQDKHNVYEEREITFRNYKNLDVNGFISELNACSNMHDIIWSHHM